MSNLLNKGRGVIRGQLRKGELHLLELDAPIWKQDKTTAPEMGVPQTLRDTKERGIQMMFVFQNHLRSLPHEGKL